MPMPSIQEQTGVLTTAVAAGGEEAGVIGWAIQMKQRLSSWPVSGQRSRAAGSRRQVSGLAGSVGSSSWYEPSSTSDTIASCVAAIAAAAGSSTAVLEPARAWNVALTAPP